MTDEELEEVIEDVNDVLWDALGAADRTMAHADEDPGVRPSTVLAFDKTKEAFQMLVEHDETRTLEDR